MKIELILNLFLDTFNWKKYPGNVFYLAIPLGILGILFCLIPGFIYAFEGKPFLLIFEFFILSLGGIAGYKLWSTYTKFVKNIKGVNE